MRINELIYHILLNSKYEYLVHKRIEIEFKME